MTVTADDVTRFARAVEARLGLRIADRLSGLQEMIGRRSAIHHETPSVYLRRVDDGDPDELRALAAEVSVGETYFFRHVEQFHAYASLVPGLLASRGLIRVLSAGCSTGEEPYTLAIVARECIPDPRAVVIQGIDFNPAALARARHARYTRWALRATPPEHEQRWFTSEGREVALARSIRDAVTFVEANLIDEGAISVAPPWDIVFCRNVLMYLGDATMRALVHKLARSLAPGGYLFLGHAETLREYPGDLELCHTHGTFYYRRSGPSTRLAMSTVTSDKPTTSPRTDDGWIKDIAAASERVRAMVDGALIKTAAAAPSAAFERIRVMVCEERFAEAQDALVALPPSLAETADAWLLRAIVAAQTGDVGSSQAACARLLATGEHRASAHYLLSISDRDAGSAERHAREASASDPSFAMASVQLAFLARRRADRAASTDHFARAITLLEREDANRLALFSGGFSRDALIELCRGELAAMRTAR